MRIAILLVLKVFKKQRAVARVVVFFTGVACRIYSRCAAERVHHKPSIVGKRGYVTNRLNCARFEQRVFFERRACLFYVDVYAEVFEREKFVKLPAEYGADFLQFVCVVGCYGEFHLSPLIAYLLSIALCILQY